MVEHTLAYRGYLIHLTHYDPRWCERKETEQPFSVEVAAAVLEELARYDFNVLIVDCSDGVEYASHPELKRHYSVPMKDLAALVKLAHEKGMDVVPKLNFAKSPRHQHDTWMRPHSTGTGYEVGDKAYWQGAGELMEELIGVCQPKEFFHIGMDEDDERTLEQYVGAVHVLRGMLKAKGLRTMMWSDACSIHYPGEPEKRGRRAAEAEKHLEQDVVQVIWNYRQVFPEMVRRIRQGGFDLWVAPAGTPELIEEWKRLMAAEEGQGMLMTQWVSCVEANREGMLERVRTAGPAYA